ncbi:MAG: M1 family aminopeptidase [Desulfuromonadales bacterium]|nr:M1 family aminopeptidase [Desulfuromonadales bacterium]
MLRILFLILILWQPDITPVKAADYGLIEQDLLIRFVPGEHRLEGRVILAPADGYHGLPEAFRLATSAEIDSVTANGKPMPFTFHNGLLQVPQPSKADSLTISYRVRFDDPVPQETVGIEDPSFGVTATIMPQGSFLSAASGWHPLPIGAQSRFRVTIVGPPGWHGVTAGRLIDLDNSATRSQAIWQTQLPQSSLTLAAGYYQVAREDLGEIQLLAFTSAENAGLAQDYLESCREYLQLYQKLFGPYPYAKFAVVENFFPTGYGFPGWTLLGSSVIRLPFILTTSLPHEIAHAWWGNAIEIDYSSGNWGEGLATYVADYYLKELYAPSEAHEYRSKILRDYAALIEADDDLRLSAFRSRTTKRDQAVGYGKSAMVFHMLRNRIGDEAFWSGLQATARQGLGKRYAWSDLQRHFEAASGMDLAAFFHQWTARAGAPQLQLTDVSVMPVDAGWQVVGSLSQNEPLYDLAVPLRLETIAQNYDQTLNLTGNRKRFVFSVNDRPIGLAVDPDNEIFRKLYAEELPATVNSLRASRVPLVIVSTGSEGLLNVSRDLLRGLQWHQAPVMSETDYLGQRPADRDLLVLGWPNDQSLRPVHPAGVTVAAQQFSIGDQVYATAEDVLFMVVTNREDKRVAGYFLPGSLDAAQDAARRIPHYGRYSYLAFRNGRNQAKATWETERSPLKLLFEKEKIP